jgi:hypothetical protein
MVSAEVVQAVLLYVPAAQTLQVVQMVSAEVVQAVLVYVPAAQTLHVVQTALLVLLHARDR